MEESLLVMLEMFELFDVCNNGSDNFFIVNFILEVLHRNKVETKILVEELVRIN